MPPSQQNPSRGSPSPESSGPRRHLYLVEMVLGGGFILLAVLIFMSGNPRNESSGRSGKDAGHEEVNPNIVTLTADNWQKEVLDSPTPVLVDFWAPWCGPCRALAPAIDIVATKLAGKVKVGKLNVDDAQEIAAEYKIQYIPEVMIFRAGVPERVRVNPTAAKDVSAANIAASIGYPLW